MSNYPKPKQQRQYFTVAIYETDRAFGGYEEGGWWYDCGWPCEDEEAKLHQRTFIKRESAQKYAQKLNDFLDRSENWNGDGRNRDLGSVCCEGRYSAFCSLGEPKPFPEKVEPWC